ANASTVLADKTVDGLIANEEKARFYAEASPSIVTPLNKLIGYESAAKIAKHAVAERISVREAVVALGFVERGELTSARLPEPLDGLSMTAPKACSEARPQAALHGASHQRWGAPSSSPALPAAPPPVTDGPVATQAGDIATSRRHRPSRDTRRPA